MRSYILSCVVQVNKKIQYSYLGDLFIEDHAPLIEFRAEEEIHFVEGIQCSNYSCNVFLLSLRHTIIICHPLGPLNIFNP
jgi:hypothetical protein